MFKREMVDFYMIFKRASNYILLPVKIRKNKRFKNLNSIIFKSKSYGSNNRNQFHRH